VKVRKNNWLSKEATSTELFLSSCYKEGISQTITALEGKVFMEELSQMKTSNINTKKQVN
jgi:hypothetical protein